MFSKESFSEKGAFPRSMRTVRSDGKRGIADITQEHPRESFEVLNNVMDGLSVSLVSIRSMGLESR